MRKLFCYLTGDGELPSDDSWAPLDYSDIVDALQDAKSHYSSNLTQEAKIVVQHYLNLIRRNIVPDQELIDQCRRLYAQHKDVLDLVFRYGEVNTFDSAANKFFENHSEVTKLFSRPGRAAVFLPTSLLEIVPEMDGVRWWGQSRPFVFWFNRYDNKLGLVLEVGPFAGERFNREHLARTLLGHFRANANAQISPNYTRVYSGYKTLTEDEAGDFEGLRATMEDVYSTVTHNHMSTVTRILRSFFENNRTGAQ
jgi:hypothetical protein